VLEAEGRWHPRGDPRVLSSSISHHFLWGHRTKHVVSGAYGFVAVRLRVSPLGRWDHLHLHAASHGMDTEPGTHCPRWDQEK